MTFRESQLPSTVVRITDKILGLENETMAPRRNSAVSEAQVDYRLYHLGDAQDTEPLSSPSPQPQSANRRCKA